jgi:diacylglycerol kinase (ATP)
MLGDRWAQLGHYIQPVSGAVLLVLLGWFVWTRLRAAGPAERRVIRDDDDADRTAILVVNAQSRRGECLFRRALDGLAQRGISIRAAYAVRDPVRIPDVVKEAVASGSRLVVVGGGDGTISSVVDHFADRAVVLGILPLGTGNSFARTLGIPVSLDDAIDVITDGKVVDVDLGMVGSDYFANVATIGFSAEVARRVSRLLKRHLGVFAYCLAGVQALVAHRSFVCRVATREREEIFRTPQVIVLNGASLASAR